MSVGFKFIRVGILFASLVALSHSVAAMERTVTLEYSPDPANPASKKFINKTPNASWCPPDSTCLAGVGTSGGLPIPGYHTDPRAGKMFHLPSTWREVEVTDGVNIKTVKVRLSGFGARTNLPDVNRLTGHSDIDLAHRAIWGNWAWYYNPAHPCTAVSRAPNITSTQYEFFINFRQMHSVCARRAMYTLDPLTLTGVTYSYELETPAPQSMLSGTYRGSISYSVGRRLDIDYGDYPVYRDSVYTLHFVLVVNHVLDVRFPPGSSTAALQPRGGWLQWLQRGRRPENLSIDQRFRFTTNNAFKMHIECQYTLGNQCGIQNGSGHQVPVESRVTLPAGINNASGQPANRQLLSPVDKHVFTPTPLVADSRAKLHS